MKFNHLVPVVALLALAVPAHAQQSPSTEQMQQRFQSMDQMMKDAHEARGPRRQQLLREHLTLMREQMQAMHGMMGGPQGAGPMGPGGGPRMQNLQERMDMMQRMQEQLMEQHEFMMKPKDED